MSVELLYQRDVYGKTLVELGAEQEQIVVCDADLSGSTRTSLFAHAYPQRFFNFGVAEQNMMAAAAGMASCGKIVFVSTFAMFATGRAWDQVRNAICYSRMNVKIVATHAGITVGPDGATHQALEDIALMRMLPGMRVIVPGDGPQTRDAVRAAAALPGPVYIRLGRDKVPTLAHSAEFAVGRAELMRSGSDVVLIACGVMVSQALAAAELLAARHIAAAVVNMHTVKPLDVDALRAVSASARAIVVCEEHSVMGGLGGAVAEVVSEQTRRPLIRRVGIPGCFGQSGAPKDLMKLFHLMPEDIAAAAQQALAAAGGDER